MAELDRFIKAHNDDYEIALKEIKAGCKRSHWMWYIFPQISGLGFSSTAQFYSIQSVEEAKAYMEDEILGNHMIELCEALLGLATNNASEVFGYPDDLKLLSCMTLFEKVVPEQELFGAVIEKYYDGKRDEKTIRLIEKQRKAHG